MSVTISGKRITLRQLSREDVTQSYVDWLNDDEVNRFLESRFQQQSLESVRSFVAAAGVNPDELLLGIFTKDNARHIGNIKLGPINRTHRRAELGIMIGDKNYWGQGVATEAVGLVTDYAFRELNLNKVEAGCYQSNGGSRRAFLKAGFRVEGYIHCQFINRGRTEDGFRLGCVNPALKPG